ncbi:MAG: hypothetical protein IJ770_01370 [Alphaproteobacteria bacterium]|nr:hypothetical protein [Alphaproteobacteria bacterium]
MQYQLILLAVLFVVIFLLHKPFNVHQTDKKWLQRLHHVLETMFTVQAMIILNELIKMYL